MKTVKILTGLLILLYSTSGWGAPSKKITLAVFGDSVAKGVWANSKMGNPGLDFYLSVNKALHIANKLTPAQIALMQQPESDLMGYSRLMEKKFGFTTNIALSATAGNQSYSFPIRLKQYTGELVKVLNVGSLAGSYKFSQYQLTQLKSKLAGGKPNYILVNFNVIDALSGDTPEMFEHNTKLFFNTLTNRYPRSQIIVTPLMDLAPISNLADTISIPKFMGLPSYSCREIQEQAYGLFKSVYTDKTETLRLQQTTVEMNQILFDEIKNIQRRHFPYWLFKGKIALTENASLVNDDWKEYLAADCIHPNLKGQEVIGNVLWDAFVNQLSTTP